MKESEFPLKKLSDFVREQQLLQKQDPFYKTPFGPGTEGEFLSSWEMSFRSIGFFVSLGGKNLFGKEEIVFINVPSTKTGIKPLANNMPFGWTGKINESIAEMAVSMAFELLSDSEISEFLKKHKPSVIFSYLDSNGPGEITVEFNGDFWIIV